MSSSTNKFLYSSSQFPQLYNSEYKMPFAIWNWNVEFSWNRQKAGDFLLNFSHLSFFVANSTKFSGTLMHYSCSMGIALILFYGHCTDVLLWALHGFCSMGIALMLFYGHCTHHVLWSLQSSCSKSIALILFYGHCIDLVLWALHWSCFMVTAVIVF